LIVFQNFIKSYRKNSFLEVIDRNIINTDKIVEIIPWFNNTFMLKMQDEKVDIPVSRNNIIEFKQIMGI